MRFLKIFSKLKQNDFILPTLIGSHVAYNDEEFKKYNEESGKISN